MTEKVTLRPAAPDDLGRLRKLFEEPELGGEYQWFGFRGDRMKELERRFETDGLLGPAESYLAVGLEEGSCAGWVVWLPGGHSGNYEIGITLFPEHRGRGIGTEAQRLLVEYLFATTPAHRLQAGTEVDNLAEQKALERVGFRKEGVQRGLHFRAGHWRDFVMYGLTRDDFAPGDASSATLEEGVDVGREPSIRQAEATDVPAVLALWLNADAEPTHTDDAASLRRLLDHDRGALLVAEAGGRVVGSVIAGWDGWRASLYRLAVAPDYRRHGLGRRLLDEAERHLAISGATRLQAIVVETDAQATAFWRASDWKEQVERLRFVKG